MNQTLITLIPKCRSPESLSNYRPISFCNTIYKIVTKIIVNRIYPFLSELISPLQVAFVPRRKGLDNAITVQELIHTMSKKKGRIGVMAIKLKLEKAYDHLEWSFVKMVLEHFGLPQNIINLIMSCISTTTIVLLFNGSNLKLFILREGLDKVIQFHPIFFCCAWSFLEAKSLACVKLRGGIRSKHLEMGQAFPMSSLLTI